MECPVCGKVVDGKRGLATHFRHSSDHPRLDDLQWIGLKDGVDYIACLECGFKSKSLARHLKSAHAMSADEYRSRHDNALIRTSSSEEKRVTAIRKARSSESYQGAKTILCKGCGKSFETPKFSSLATCPSCILEIDNAKWGGLIELEDYVSCLECNYRAESLVMHVRTTHPGYRGRHPEAMMTSLNSRARDKTYLKGRLLSKSTRLKMSMNAGRWNKGLTKATSSSLRAASEKMVGRKAWSLGLTAQTDARLQGTAEKLRLYVGENRHWKNGNQADLTLADFEPVLDAVGRVDRKRAVELLGVCWTTISRYMETYGLEMSDVNIRARSQAQIIRLEVGDFEPYRMKSGKVSISKATQGLRHHIETVRREIKRNGLVVAGGRVSQGRCLQAISRALSSSSDLVKYTEEWKSYRFKNPKTGWRYRYDGFFPSHNLIVEFHGHQHFLFPNAFHKTEDAFLATQEKDNHKRELIESAPDLKYLEIRYDEPYDNVMYLKGRLFALGIR